MRRHLRVLLAYLALSLLLTWPLAAHFGTHVPGDGIDDPALVWNLWWAKHALVDQLQNPFACDWIFWPVGINLAFYTLTLLNGTLALPVQAAIDLIPAYNLLLLASFVLGGYGAFLLALDFLARRPALKTAAVPAAFLAGAFYAFAGSKMFYAALGQGNIASSQYAPFAMLYLVRAARRGGRPRDAVLAALFLSLQAYAELTFASFLLLFAALVWVWHALARRPSALRALFTRGAVVAVLFAVALAPVLANMLPDLDRHPDLFASGGGFSDIFSADLAGYVLPTQLHPLLGGAVRTLSYNSAPQPGGGQFAVDKGQQIFLGYAALLLALAGAARARSRDRWLWAALAAFFFLLTLGPELRIAGRSTGIPLPFALVERLPFFQGNRYPSRYSVLLLASLAPLVAAGASAVLSRLPRRALWAVTPALLALLLFEHLSVPLPLSDQGVPPIYRLVAAEPGDGALWELPSGWRNGARVLGKKDVLIMQELRYQTVHGKRILGGNTSRNPEFNFQYFAEDPTLARFIGLVDGADLPAHAALRAELDAQPVTASDRERARAWAAFLGLRYVIVHRDAVPTAAEALLNELLEPELWAEDGALALYRIRPESPPARYDLAMIGAPAGRMALGSGWGPAGPGGGAWTEGDQAELLLPLAGRSGLRLGLRAAGPGVTVGLWAGGRSLGVHPVTQDGAPLVIPLPPGAALEGPLTPVRLRFNTLVPGISLTGRGGTLPMPGGPAFPASLLVASAGADTGDFGRVYADGEQVAPDRRGYNVAAFDPQGRLIASAAFDTHLDPAAGTRLRDWLAAQPAGTVVAGAVRDEGSLALDQAGVDGLRLVGVTGDLRGKFRCAHAFIGVRGASPGQAAESVACSLPARLSIGLPLSAPVTAGQVEVVELE